MGLVFVNLLPSNAKINLEVYCQQLEKLNEAMAEKLPELINSKGVFFHHDNAGPHTSGMACSKLLEISCNVFPHPLYLPDLVASD